MTNALFKEIDDSLQQSMKISKCVWFACRLNVYAFVYLNSKIYFN